LRDKLRTTLNNGRNKGWNDDEPAVVQAAGEIILRQYFGASYDVQTVSDFVVELRAATNNDGQFPRLKTEAVIRTALGETDVDTSDIELDNEIEVAEPEYEDYAAIFWFAWTDRGDELRERPTTIEGLDFLRRKERR
jgi:hypothetical protein